MLKPDNPMAPAEGARFVAIHAGSRCFARLVVELIPEDVTSLDQYLDVVIAMEKKRYPGFEELGRSEFPAAQRRWRRSEVSWEKQEETFDGVVLVTRDGWHYYALAVWSSRDAGEEVLKRSREAHEAVEIGGQSVKDLVAGITEENPYISEETAKRVIHTAMDRQLGLSQVGPLLQAAMQKGASLLTSEEQREVEALFGKAGTYLTQQESAVISHYFSEVGAKSDASKTKSKEAWALIWKGMQRLPATEGSRFAALYDKAIRAGLK